MQKAPPAVGAARSALCTLLLCLGLVACDAQENGVEPFDENISRNLAPADAELADIYNRSCRSCHTIASTGAPLTGDTITWNARLTKGMPVLVENVVTGYGGMPPFGLCMDCNEEQFEALIRFMAAAP